MSETATKGDVLPLTRAFLERLAVAEFPSDQCGEEDIRNLARHALVAKKMTKVLQGMAERHDDVAVFAMTDWLLAVLGE